MWRTTVVFPAPGAPTSSVKRPRGRPPSGRAESRVRSPVARPGVPGLVVSRTSESWRRRRARDTGVGICWWGECASTEIPNKYRRRKAQENAHLLVDASFPRQLIYVTGLFIIVPISGSLADYSFSGTITVIGNGNQPNESSESWRNN
jgi:hypothetical protein